MRSDLTWNVITKDLQGLARRMETTSQNIANANTPGYARREVSFEDQLRDVIGAPRQLPLKTTAERHMSNIATDISGVQPLEARVGHETYRLDGNNVDPETEMARLAQTRMSYQAMTRVLSRKIAMYRKAIGGAGS